MAALSPVACARTEQYGMSQPIAMGPYTFAVEDAAAGTWGSDRTVDIRLRVLRDDSAPFTSSFQSFFAYRLQIVDEGGNRFWVDPHPVSPIYRAGRWRSDRYLARVRLSPDMEGVRDRGRLGSRVGDFSLIVDNPAPGGEQPRRVTVPLR